MIVKKIRLKNFRNYEDLYLEFNDKINIIYGMNAQGKTNILEALYMLSCGSSHRTNQDKYILMEGKNEYSIELQYVNDIGIEDKLKLKYDNKNKKTFYFNDIKKNKLSELIGKINIVFFSPEDLDVVKKSPALRRRAIDISLSQIRPSYFSDLQIYYKILKQRNNLIKKLDKKPELIETLDIWTNKISIENTKIIKKRIKYIDLLDSYAKKYHSIISGGKEKLEIKYDSFIKDAKNKKSLDIDKEIINKYNKNRKYEIKKGYTSFGIHRDDIIFYLNGKDSKEFCSQGQQRSIVLSYKLAELEIMKKHSDNLPVLLLDDVFSELDNNRKKHIFKMIENVQTFITCTDKDEIDYKKEKEYTQYYVENGEVRVN